MPEDAEGREPSEAGYEGPKHETKSKGFLTKKHGPLPTWGWIVVGGAGLLFLVVRAKRNAASSSSGTAQPATAYGPGTLSTGSVQSGYAGSLADQLGGLGAQLGQIQSALTPPSQTFPQYSDVSGMIKSGAGYMGTGKALTAPVYTPQGVFEWVVSLGQAQAIQGSGGQLYFQDLPGHFQPITYDQYLHLTEPGTAIYAQNPSLTAPLGPNPSSLSVTSGPVAPV